MKEYFELFADQTSVKPFLTKPFYTTDGYSFAGNEYMMIWERKDYGFERTERNMSGIIPKTPLVKPFRVEVSEIIKAVNTYYEKSIYCETCKGTGEIHCPYCDVDSECKDCDGVGTICNEVYFSINGVRFSRQSMNKLSQFAHNIGEQYIYFNTRSSMTFSLGVGIYNIVLCGNSGVTDSCEITYEEMK
jgi:hypothetical protein